MVLVEEVPEDVLLKEGEQGSDWETDSATSEASSSLSDDEDFSPADEGLYDRLVALKDIIPPQTRSSLVATYQSTKEWAWWSVQSAGSVAWWVSTSALLVGLPLALAIEDETRVVQQERELQMQSAGQQQVRSHPLMIGQGTADMDRVASRWTAIWSAATGSDASRFLMET